MFADDNAFRTALMDHKVYSAWQFIEYTRKNIETVQYCFVTLNNIISKLSTKTVRWEQDLFSDFVEDVVFDGKKARRITVTTENMPVYELHVAGEKVDPWFLFDKLLRDFYQYCMNGFDSISQIANAGLLANKGKKVDSVDFQRMASCFAQTTYKAAFPKTSTWFETVDSSPEFKYIEAINNRTKHTADIANKLSLGILGSSNNTKIGPFFRKDVQHGEQELTDQLLATLDFLNNSFDEFLTVFCEEFILDMPDVEEAFRSVITKRPKIKDSVIWDELHQNSKTGFLWIDKDGHYEVAQHWSNHLRWACAKFNRIYKEEIPSVTPHVCRHTFCSNCAGAGMSPKTLQMIMGHSSIEFTLNVP